jgi:hypothetical protein
VQQSSERWAQWSTRVAERACTSYSRDRELTVNEELPATGSNGKQCGRCARVPRRCARMIKIHMLRTD